MSAIRARVLHSTPMHWAASFLAALQYSLQNFTGLRFLAVWMRVDGNTKKFNYLYCEDIWAVPIRFSM